MTRKERDKRIRRAKAEHKKSLAAIERDYQKSKNDEPKRIQRVAERAESQGDGEASRQVRIQRGGRWRFDDIGNQIPPWHYLTQDVCDAIERIGAVFTIRDVMSDLELHGKYPIKESVRAVLRKLESDECLIIVELGSGSRPTRYVHEDQAYRLR